MAEKLEKKGPQYPTPDVDYQPGWAAKALGGVFGGTFGISSNSIKPYNTAESPGKVRLSTVKVWSDIQKQMVPAYEYLRETEPVADTIVNDTVDGVETVGGKYAKRRFKWLDPEKVVREKAISASTALIPVVGKALGKAGKTIMGMDVTEMGDATIDGARRRANESARYEYDRLAVHFKRNEVLAAVRGDAYQPNFLQGIEHVRKVTDGFQDFELKGQYGESFIDRRAMDQSPAGEAYRDAMWMGKETDPREAYKSAKSASLGKVTMNYDQKNALPVA